MWSKIGTCRIYYNGWSIEETFLQHLLEISASEFLQNLRRNICFTYSKWVSKKWVGIVTYFTWLQRVNTFMSWISFNAERELNSLDIMHFMDYCCRKSSYYSGKNIDIQKKFVLIVYSYCEKKMIRSLPIKSSVPLSLEPSERPIFSVYLSTFPTCMQ